MRKFLVFLAALALAGPAAAATRLPDLWEAALVQPQVTSDHFSELAARHPRKNTNAQESARPGLLIPLLNIYVATVLAAIIADRLPSPRRPSQAAVAADARSRMR